MVETQIHLTESWRWFSGPANFFKIVISAKLLLVFRKIKTFVTFDFAVQRQCLWGQGRSRWEVACLLPGAAKRWWSQQQEQDPGSEPEPARKPWLYLGLTRQL